MKHTATPWRISKGPMDLPGDDIVSIRSGDLILVGEVYAQNDGNENWSPLPNAELLVRAVNCHEELTQFLDDTLSGNIAGVSADQMEAYYSLLARARGKE